MSAEPPFTKQIGEISILGELSQKHKINNEQENDVNSGLTHSGAWAYNHKHTSTVLNGFEFNEPSFIFSDCSTASLTKLHTHVVGEIPTGHLSIQILLLLILPWWLSLVNMGKEWNKIVKRAVARKKQYFRNGMDSVRAKPLDSCLGNRENVMINRSRAC